MEEEETGVRTWPGWFFDQRILGGEGGGGPCCEAVDKRRLIHFKLVWYDCLVEDTRSIEFCLC